MDKKIEINIEEDFLKAFGNPNRSHEYGALAWLYESTYPQGPHVVRATNVEDPDQTS